MSQDLKKLLGNRILSEANDIKRTISALAVEIDVEEDKLKEIVKGECDIQETYAVINKMGKRYPIDVSDLYIDEDDCTKGVRIMSAKDSAASKRIFDRKDASGSRTPYYDYRDTAMSKLGPFKPEWIQELRVVNDADPYNPDVAYNNGHFLHQMTFFIGPVNFYWEINGKKFCKEMNTGDSNYITPFWPHSFTSRDPKQTALILAVTYGGDVRRAQKELYMLGPQGIKDFVLDYRDHNRGTIQLIKQHLANENMTVKNLEELAKAKSIPLDVKKLFDEHSAKSFEDLSFLARCLDIEVSDLLIPAYKEEEVVVRYHDEKDAYLFPGREKAAYKIWPLAKSSKMPLMKGSNIEVLCQGEPSELLGSSLHSYVYNYCSSPLKFTWVFNGENFKAEIGPGDSVYIQPFVKHAFANVGAVCGQLIMIRVSGAVNFSAQKELSYFANVERIIETKCWFD